MVLPSREAHLFLLFTCLHTLPFSLKDVLGTYNIVYTAVDASGNDMTFTLVVNVVEATAPMLELVGPSPLMWTAGQAWSDPGATASDLVDGNLNSFVSTSYPMFIPVGTPGEFTVVYSLDYTNSRGLRAANITRRVIVVDMDDPARS